MTALAQMMEAKGYNPQDTSLSTLVTELSHIMTEADMTPYALTSSLSNYVAKAAPSIKTADYVIQPTDFYNVLEANKATSITFTLPVVGTIAAGSWIKLKNIGAGELTISGEIDGVSPSTALSQWEEITIYTDGTGWRGKVISAADSSSFDCSLTENGYQKLPSGLIMQWGKYSGTVHNDTAYSLTFPMEFPTACLNAVSNAYINPASNLKNGYMQISAYTTVGMTVFCQADYIAGIEVACEGFFWQAIGY
jgi:hypothetical protein